MDEAEQQQQQQQVHDHSLDASLRSGGAEQSAVYAIASLGLLSNLGLIGLILAQRHTRRLRLAFLLHSALLNLLMSGLAFAFGNGLRPAGISSDSCRNLTTSYIIFQTVWVFNLIPAVCCEIYYLDSGAGRPRGSACCVGFGVALVYTCSTILHLGPTLIGANYDWTGKDARCMFLHGHPKNYAVYLMWMAIVIVALGVTAYYLATFHRSIDSSMRCRLRNAALEGLQKRRSEATSAKASAAAATMAEAMLNSDALLAGRLSDLAALKANRHRVLWGIFGIFVICWCPLYLLVLADPQFKAPLPVYHLFTVLGFAKTLLEPLCIAAFDRAVGRPFMQLWPCTRQLRYVSEEEIDARLSAAASAGCPERSDSTSVIASASTTGRRSGGGPGGASTAAASPPPMLLSGRALATRFLLTTPDHFAASEAIVGHGQERFGGRYSPAAPDQVFSPASPLNFY